MNRNMMILGAWVLGLLFPIEMIAKTSCTDNSTRLWYNAPAQQWLEALPIGNSHLGGMVYGGTTDENIQLNEETFWSGGPHNNNRIIVLDFGITPQRSSGWRLYL